jgi:hypothetical protein
VDRRATVMMLPVNTFSLILLTSWHEMFEGTVWWWALLVLRNLLFILVGVYLARSSGASASSPDHRSRLSIAAGGG